MNNVVVSRGQQIAASYVAAVVVGMLCVVVPLLAYLNYRAVFGPSAEATLVGVCATGGAVAGALFAARGLRVAGFASGVVGGVCGAAAFLLAARLYPQAQELWAPKGWLLLVFALGAQAGVALFWLLARLKKRGSQ